MKKKYTNKIKKNVSLVLIIFAAFVNIAMVSADTLNTNTTLRKGSQGADVSTLQMMLNKILECNMTVDGKFGSMTYNYVVEFQKKYDLTQDGVVGYKTREKLNEVYKSITNTVEESASKEKTNEASEDILKLTTIWSLKKGSQGENVSILQKMLNRVLGCNMTVDGNFENTLYDYVVIFQEKYDLGIDGIVGIKTRQKLNEVYELLVKNDININGEIQNTLQKGSQGIEVNTLQIQLNKIFGCNMTVDGKFGSKTYNYVVEFQNRNGITANGIVDEETRSKLNEEYKKAMSIRKVLIISNNPLNVRTDASTTSPIITTVNQKEVYTYTDIKLANNKIWLKIEYEPGEFGYIYGSSSYVSTTFVLTSIDNQSLSYYKEGQELLYTPIVTGNEGNYDTPKGLYKIYQQYRDTGEVHLVGKNDDDSSYDVIVTYWMGFIGNSYGFHDRITRESFGGTVYKGNGSHGCVNMPFAAAEKLYSYTTSTTDVLVTQ